jgi:hypothetical protein
MTLDGRVEGQAGRAGYLCRDTLFLRLKGQAVGGISRHDDYHYHLYYILYMYF